MRAASFLAGNTLPIMADLVRVLSERLGLRVEFDPDAPRGSPDARRRAADADLVWMCGHLTTSLLAEGIEAEIVAAPVFVGEPGAVYRSVVIARHDGPADVSTALAGRVAINEIESWSGHRGLRQWLAGEWFTSEITTGSHRQSIGAVASGAADTAGIDVTVWQDVCESEPATVNDLQVIGTTNDWPAPPFSVSARLNSPLRSQLVEALTSVGPGDVAGLERIVTASADDYRSMVT